MVANGDVLNNGDTKHYYGSTATIDNLTLNGGELIVCGDLTVDKFYMNKGTVFILPGGRFVIGSGIGAGLELKGGCSIYNYGTCEIQRNLSLEDTGTALFPNIIINATVTSQFKMANQYFVINNNYSWFVNNGSAEFWGIITDVKAAIGSVCLGNASSTRMAILINKVADSYTVSSGTACVNVFQLSEFYGQLTTSPALFACLGSGHVSSTSCIPFGCTPNSWGAAQVFTNCSGCNTLAIVGTNVITLNPQVFDKGYVSLSWRTDMEMQKGMFRVRRSSDGSDFKTIDSLPVTENTGPDFKVTDKNPLPGNNFYMINYINSLSGRITSSRVEHVAVRLVSPISIYPVPFDNNFFITYDPATHPRKIIVTDITGRRIKIKCQLHQFSRQIEVEVLDQLQPDVYLVHLQTDKGIIARTVIKR